jgi:hypothetical protein
VCWADVAWVERTAPLRSAESSCRAVPEIAEVYSCHIKPSHPELQRAILATSQCAWLWPIRAYQSVRVVLVPRLLCWRVGAERSGKRSPAAAANDAAPRFCRHTGDGVPSPVAVLANSQTSRARRVLNPSCLESPGRAVH